MIFMKIVVSARHFAKKLKNIKKVSAFQKNISIFAIQLVVSWTLNKK